MVNERKGLQQNNLTPGQRKEEYLQLYKGFESTSPTEPNWGKYLGRDSNQIREQNRWQVKDDGKERDSSRQ